MDNRALGLVAVASMIAACGGSPPGGAPDGPSLADLPAQAPPGEPLPGGGGGGDRPLLTSEECAAKGGSVVGDIGDGATHRPDYLCASGVAPIGNVQLGVEGSVCCPGGPEQGTSAPAP